MTLKDGWEQVGAMLPNILPAVGRGFGWRADFLSPKLVEIHALLLHIQIQHLKNHSSVYPIQELCELIYAVLCYILYHAITSFSLEADPLGIC